MQKLNTIIPCVFNQIRPGATFLSVYGYTNNHQEVSNFGIVFHANYFNAIKKSLDIWKNYSGSSIEESVKQKLIDSYTKSLTGYNPNARSAFAYTEVTDASGKKIPGVKWHTANNELHLWGFLVHKKIVEPGIYKPVNSSIATITRKELLKLTPLSRFRQFKLVDGRFHHIGVEKLTLTQKDLLRKL